MKHDLLITGISQLVTAEGAGPRRGRDMSAVKLVENAAIAVSSGRIAWTGRESDWSGETAAKWDVSGHSVVPGLVDPHTHAVWAGDRLNDFEARTSGKSYESILAAGGGIWSEGGRILRPVRRRPLLLCAAALLAFLRGGPPPDEFKPA